METLALYHSKGQTFMPDFMASMLIFAVLIAIFLTTWNSMVSTDTSNNMMLQTRHTSTFLVGTSGYPSNWEKDTVKVTVPGFVEEDHVLSQEKLLEFRNKTYERQTELLQTGDYYMEIRNESEVLELNGKPLKFGKNYTNASQIYPVRRNALYNDSGNLKSAELVYVTWQ